MNQLLATGCQLPCRGRALAVPAILFIASLQGVARECTAQQLTAQTRYSTHDWTAPVGFSGESIDYREFWADVKTPGDGYAYAVGTIEVQDTRLGSQFSQQPASPSGASAFLLGANVVRQVVMLQRTGVVSQLNQPQRYFYGNSPVAQNLRSTSARGISVWPQANPADTRVVICGETYDQTLPQSQDSLVGFTSAVGNNATGFLAVYDGNLNLLWTHHFFGTRATGQSAVTDISVRVVGEPGDQRDVITYCGISTFGSPAGGNAWMTPVRPFTAPSSTALCGASVRAWANGSTDNGSAQWDGFVGRLSRGHAPGGTTAVDFHSVVGGTQQDGLFGISELEGNKFAVCGSSSSAGTVSAGLVSPGVCVQATDTYCVGTVMVFDASPVAGGGALKLELAEVIGQPGAMHTIARDIHAQPGANVPYGGSIFPDLIIVAGSTDDPGLPNRGLLRQTAFSGPTDGFLWAGGILQAPAGPSLAVQAVEYQGLPGASGYTGVNAWNEFANHAVATGFREQAGSPGVSDFDIASYYLETSAYPLPPATVGMRLLTRGGLGGSAEDRPTAMGPQEVTIGGFGPSFQTFGLGNHAGGGVAQGSSGRVQVVGTTVSVDFPVVGTGRPRSTVLIPAGLASREDAVRAVLDLLPFGVRRTDGTGNSLNLAGLVFPPTGTDGGTTPPCGRQPFGRQVGVAPPLLAQTRLLIDFDGPPPAAGTNAGIVVVRTPPTAGWTLAAIQIGFPGVGGLSPIPILVNSSEVWTPFYASLLSFPAAPNATFYALIPGFPPPPAQFTIQAFFLLSSSVEGGNPAQGILCGGTETVVATPALYIDY